MVALGTNTPWLSFGPFAAIAVLLLLPQPDAANFTAAIFRPMEWAHVNHVR
jgi:hypothetical protein